MRRVKETAMAVVVWLLFFWALAIAAMVGMALLVSFPKAASAHEWYPRECCSGYDCAPVQDTRVIPDPKGGLPTVVVTARYPGGTFTTIVPPNALRRQSKDGRQHICMKQYESILGSTHHEFLCIFDPPGL